MRAEQGGFSSASLGSGDDKNVAKIVKRIFKKNGFKASTESKPNGDFQVIPGTDCVVGCPMEYKVVVKW